MAKSTFASFFGGTMGIMCAIAFVVIGIPVLACSGCLGVFVTAVKNAPPVQVTTPNQRPLEIESAEVASPVPEVEKQKVSEAVAPPAIADLLEQSEIKGKDGPKAKEIPPLERLKGDEAKSLAETEWRTWTSGTFKTEAKLLSRSNGEVTLKRKDGKVITVPIGKLSTEDHRFLEQENKSVNP